MASSHSADIQRVIGKDRVTVHGKFRPDGSSGIVSDSEDGHGWSVARTSVGLYTITLDKPMPALISHKASVRDADGVGVQACFGDYDADAGTIQLRTFLGGSKGELPLDITSLREIGSDDIQALAAHGGLLASDSDPSLSRVSTSTDKALRVVWDTSNDTDEVQFPPIPMLPSMSGANDISVHLLAVMAGATDTPTIDVQAFDGVGDTEMGSATAALSNTLAEVSATIANADLGGHPTGFLNVSLVPGAHTTDALYLYAAWLEWAKLVDLTADADNEVSFELNFRNNGGSY